MTLTLPLMGNQFAYLEVPRPLTEEQYSYMLELLEVFRPGLTGVLNRGLTNEATLLTDAHLERAGAITLEMRHKLLKKGFTPAQIHGLDMNAAERLLGAIQ